jgi:hypothetical protein
MTPPRDGLSGQKGRMRGHHNDDRNSHAMLTRMRSLPAFVDDKVISHTVR